ncbi:unnamed protein product [Lactuca virosa]|uniref:Uncharacterized protein n=1 Tax=Lactuca virosa TaxID=75947 RepID=A0AAU9M3C7_9ASTR|nr:unnamed protein product [Lactuca virosa]
MAATTLFSAPITPHQHPISISSFGSKSSRAQSPFILLRGRASSSTSSSTVDKQEEEESSSSDILTNQSGGCKACGKAEIGWGCNGEGRIQGGIATVPGFGWWPIKAYRPCPDFVATGGRYRRQGQSMDEVAGFGSVPRISATTTTSSSAATEETQSSDKKQGPKKFKR